MITTTETQPYYFEEGIFECALHLTQRQLDAISVMGFYDVHRGKLRLSMQRHIMKETIINALNRKQLPHTKDNFIEMIYRYFKHKVEQTPSIMGEYISDVVYMSTISHEKNYKRHKRILDLPSVEYENIKEKTKLNYNGNQYDVSEWYIEYRLTNKLVLAIHPMKLRLINTDYNFVIARTKKTDIDSTGIQEFTQFLITLYKKQLMTKEDVLLLKKIFVQSYNLTVKPLTKLN